MPEICVDVAMRDLMRGMSWSAGISMNDDALLLMCVLRSITSVSRSVVKYFHNSKPSSRMESCSVFGSGSLKMMFSGVPMYFTGIDVFISRCMLVLCIIHSIQAMRMKKEKVAESLLSKNFATLFFLILSARFCMMNACFMV